MTDSLYDVAGLLCEQSDCPPCDVLLEPPPDLAEWPDHVCETVARESTYRYASQRLPEVSGSRAGPPGPIGAESSDLHRLNARRQAWAARWPLVAAPDARERRQRQAWATPDELVDVPGLPPDTPVGLVVQMASGLVLFAPVAPMETVGPFTAYWWAQTPLFEVAGPVAGDGLEAVAKERRTVERWHRKALAGLKVGHGGRKRGSRAMTRERFVARYPGAYAAACAAHPRRPPSRREVADRLGVNRHTFRRYLVEYMCAWPPVAAADDPQSSMAQ